MHRKILISLAAPPAAAALAVVALSGLSLRDLEVASEKAEREDSEALQTLKRPRTEPVVPRAVDLPELTEEEALGRLDEAPSRAAVLRLWPLPEHRERLFEVLLATDTPEEVRLHLLGAFEADSPPRALEAARALLAEKDLEQGPLLFSAYEIIARHGEARDLALLDARPFELHQTKALREEYRDSLQKRVGSRG